MAIEYNFTLDMDRSKRDNNIAYARTGDIDSIVINADLVLDGAAYTPTGTNAFFECITPNGCSIRAAAEKTGSTVSVDVPSAAFQAAGVINVAYFRFESGDASNPTYVESTEPFAIVVREGIGDNIDAGDYIEEWRQLADHLETVVADVEQKAEQAETAINEQKTEVDELKAKAQTAIAGDVTEVETAAQSAINAINQEKADVADAAEGVTAAGDQAISQFKTDSQQAVNKFKEDSQQAVDTFNTNGASAINQFNTNGTSAIDQFNTDADSKLGEVDDMITEAQGDVDAAVTQLENETQNAIKVAQDALDGTTAANLQNAINRTMKLDVADMTNIPDNSSLSSFTNVGSYCCKTAATAATVGDCPVDDSPFNMYVFSSATSGQVMQLVIPIDLNGKPTAEWHVRFGTSSAMDPWSVIGGGADIAAGLGIDVTGDTQKTVALDTDAFYQHYGAANIIQGSTEVTGGGRVKELRVKGKTWVNRWPAHNYEQNGATFSTDDTGLVTVSCTNTTGNAYSFAIAEGLVAGKTYVGIVSATVANIKVRVQGTLPDADSSSIIGMPFTTSGTTIQIPAGTTDIKCVIALEGAEGTTVNASFRVMLVDGTEAPDCFTPPASIASVETGKLVTSGKNLLDISTWTKVGDSGQLTVQPDGSWKCDGYSNYGGSGFVSPTLPPGSYHVDVSNFTDGAQVGLTCSVPQSGFVWNEVWSKYDCDYVAFSVKNFTFVSSVPFRIGIMINSSMHGEELQSTIYVYDPQLELGSTATSYEPPTVTETPLPEVELRGLPNGTCDELVIKADGSCEVERNTVQIMFDGSEDENWGQYIQNASAFTAFCFNFFVDSPINTGTSQASAASAVVCRELPVIPGGFDLTIPSVSVSSAVADRLYVTAPSTVTDIDSFKQWLAADPITCVVDVTGKPDEPQSTITLPALPAPTFNQYHDADIPTEIEAEVVKVDYLPAPDVYTREEVDQKIEAGSMPEIVPVSQGGTGVTTAAAERNRLGLGNTTGALSVANGGTGKTTAMAAQNALLGGISASSTDVSDETLFVGYYVSPSDATGAIYKRSASTVWSWIASKIRSVFGFNASNVLPVDNGGTGATSAKAAQNSLLNDMNVSSDPLTDSSMLVGYNASPSVSNGAVHRRSMTTIWDYVVGKIRSTFGFDSSNVLKVSNGGTGLTANPSILVNLGSDSTSNVLVSSPRPGVTGTLPVSHGGTGATAPGVDMLSNLGITFGTADPPSTGTPGSIYIQYFE